jgi:hypothetical protein
MDSSLDEKERTAMSANRQAAELHEGAAAMERGGKSNAAYMALASAAAAASEKAIAASIATL